MGILDVLKDFGRSFARDAASGTARGVIEKTTGVDPYNAGTTIHNRIVRKDEAANKALDDAKQATVDEQLKQDQQDKAA